MAEGRERRFVRSKVWVKGDGGVVVLAVVDDED